MEEKESPDKEALKKEAILIADRRIARLGDRLIALIIDSVFIAIVFAVIGMWAASRWGGITEIGFSIEGTPALVAILATILFAFLYYWILEGIFGATLGKVIIGIQVRKKDGSSCGMGSSLIRNLLRIIDGIGIYLVGFLVAIFSKMRQRIGDHLANTVVIERKFGMGLRALSVILWLAGIIGGIWIAYSIHSGIPKPVATQPLVTVPSAPVVTSPVIASGDLKIINFRFAQSKDGPVRPESPYRPGDKVYTDYDVTGYTTDHEGKLHLLFTVVSLDPGGLPLYAPYKHELHQTVSKAGEPVNSYFNFDLPLYVPAGKFNIHIKVHDSVKNTDSELIQSFTVEAVPIAPSTRLEFRDCHFSLSEGGTPLTQPVIQAGGTIHSSCRVSGIQFREDRPDVYITFKVIGPRGETVIDKPTFLTLNDSYFYRPPTFFEKLSAWVTLPSNAARGKYTWRYTMTDRIANTKADYEANFEAR